MCTISDTEFKELIKIGRKTDRYEFLLESYFFDYIVDLTKNDEDGKQELILKLIESFDKFDLDSDKNYDLLKYYRYRLIYWYKQFNIEKNGIIKRGDSLKINNLFKKDKEILTDKELYDLQKYKNIKYMDEMCDNFLEYSMENSTIDAIHLSKLAERLTDEQKDILIGRLKGETLQQIADRYKCTRENIRQHLEKIKKRLTKV
jgi:RNA polymerase sigma factor (sigma-70 family)